MIRYKCKNCGYILYEYNGVRDYRGLLTPLEVATMYAFICPNCGKKLNPNIHNPDYREHVVIKHSTSKTRRSLKKTLRQHAVNSDSGESSETRGVEWVSNTEFIVSEY